MPTTIPIPARLTAESLDAVTLALELAPLLDPDAVRGLEVALAVMAEAADLRRVGIGPAEVAAALTSR